MNLRLMPIAPGAPRMPAVAFICGLAMKAVDP
jgi:hypothetical protein